MSGEGITVVAFSYSLGARAVSEAAATCVAIYLGDGVIASALLAKSKGQGMGWTGISLGFGLAFGMASMMFNYISATMNPAAALALVVVGQLSAVEFFVLAAAELAGAFCGAVLVYLHFLPHFHTVPEPQAVTAEDLLLRSRDSLPQDALNVASYNTRIEPRAQAPQTLRRSLSNAMGDVKHYFGMHQDPGSHQKLLELALGRNELKETSRMPTLRRHSVGQDAQRRLERINVQEFNTLMSIPQVPLKPSNPGGAMPRDSSKDEIPSSAGGSAEEGDPRPDPDALRRARLYEAAIVADQNSKLSIFCTRPAIYSPVFNFLTEFLSTVALVFGALMISARSALIYQPSRAVYSAVSGGWIGFFIFLCVLGLGGPTGIAANPARDFGPRLAHFLLPIPGKGPSEFYYSWIPILAPFAGGAVAGGLYVAFQKLNHSVVPSVVL